MVRVLMRCDGESAHDYLMIMRVTHRMPQVAGYFPQKSQ